MSRVWHKNFLEYTQNISNHPNYHGLYIDKKASQVKWVVAGKSDNGIKRRKWWDKKCKQYSIEIKAGCYALVALKVHPTKKHVCQICGKSLSLEYVYPNKKTIKFFNENFGINIKPYEGDIFEIIKSTVSKNAGNLAVISKKFKYPGSSTVEELNNNIRKDHTNKHKKSFLSPGAMSNSPDRFDGFHSDGACCRHKSDKGRHKTNLSRYNQDRRAYENWADGNWKKADRLMSEFSNHGVSADHIGPISLGFCHRPKFAPLSKEDNSSKNNRMDLNDVQTLINDEAAGSKVVSWHSKPIWDLLKNKIHSDSDAKKLSSVMRTNLHQILIVFSKIDEEGYSDFLKSFLNPEYSFYDYKFHGFDPKTGLYKSVDKKKLVGQNQKNNVDRYYRVAFETLEKYRQKDNRRSYLWSSPEVDKNIALIYKELSTKNIDKAKQQLEKTIELLANLNMREF
jgi:Alw26I/Eco31I/Esp3I family type II restriction endonuclease